MLDKYLKTRIFVMTDGGRRPISYPQLIEQVRADVAETASRLLRSGCLSQHLSANGVKIINWKGGYRNGTRKEV